jgi:hypothetical protein
LLQHEDEIETSQLISMHAPPTTHPMIVVFRAQFKGVLWETTGPQTGHVAGRELAISENRTATVGELSWLAYPRTTVMGGAPVGEAAPSLPDDGTAEGPGTAAPRLDPWGGHHARTLPETPSV